MGMMRRELFSGSPNDTVDRKTAPFVISTCWRDVITMENKISGIQCGISFIEPEVAVRTQMIEVAVA